MSISQFFTTATGPSKLYSDLGLRTKWVRTFLKTLETVSKMRSEVPVSVLGEELYALMSDCLRQRLLSLEESDEIMETVPDTRLRLTTGSDVNFCSASTDFPSLALEKESKSQFSSQEPELHGEKQVFPLPSPHQVVKESTSPQDQHKSEVRKPEAVPPIQFPNKIVVEPDLWEGVGEGKIIQLEGKTEMVRHSGDRPSLADKRDHLSKVKQSRSGIESLLVKKLDDYWQLSQQEQATGQNSSHGNNGDKEHPGRAIPPLSSPLNAIVPPSWSDITEPEVTQKASSIASSQGTSGGAKTIQANLPLDVTASAPWSDMIGREVAEKVRSIASGQTTSRSAQTIPTNLPEKVEIQNIFKVEVKPQTDNQDSSVTDLSEKIADIIREQALQHGIDIT